MVDFNTPAGFGFVAGRGQERARQVLEATEEAGFDPNTVLTRRGGYLAPQEVVDSIADADEATVQTLNEAEATTEAAATEQSENTEESNGSEEKTEEPASSEDQAEAAPADVEEQPAGNASTEEWAAWAVKNKGYDEAEGLKRSELIERFGA